MIRKIAVYAVLLASVMAADSCVNEQYELSDESLDLNVSIFQEGLTLPLGSTAKVRMDSLVSRIGLSEEYSQYFVPGEDGSYSLSFTSEEPIDLSESLNVFTELNINKINMSKSISFSLADVSAANFGYPGLEFAVRKDIAGIFQKMDVDIPEISARFELEEYLGDYVSDFEDMDLRMDMGGSAHSTSFVLASLDKNISVPSYLLENQQVANKQLSLQEISNTIGKSVSLKGKIENASVETCFMYDLPKEVKAVHSMNLKEGAKLRIKLMADRPCFSSGSVISHLNMNLGDLFELENKAGVVADNCIDADFVLGSENSWTAVQEFYIKSIVVDDDDWEDAINGDGEPCLRFNKVIRTNMSGALSDGGLATSLAYLADWLSEHADRRDIHVDVEISLEDFVLSDFEVEMHPQRVHYETYFDIEVPEVSLPKEISSVEELVFSDDSQIRLDMQAVQLPDMGIMLDLERLEVTFPSDFKIQGADLDNAVSMNVGPIGTSVISNSIGINGLVFGRPDENGKIPASKERVLVKMDFMTGGVISTGSLTSAKPFKFKGDITSNIKVDDYSVKVKDFSVNSEDNPDVFKSREIKIEIPEQMGGVQGLAVRFKDEPAISIDIDIPAISAGIRPLGEDGLQIKFPDMLKFKTQSPYAYLEWFDPVGNALVFPAGRDLPESLSLPIDCIVVNPVKDHEDNKYYASGLVQVVGAIGIESGAVIKKADVDALSTPGTEFRFEAVIPQLEVDGVSMTAYSSTIEQTIEFAPLKNVKLPSQLDYVDKLVLDDVYLAITMVPSQNFPDLGEDAVLSLGVDLTLPDFIVIDDPRYKDGKLSVLGTLEKQPSGRMELAVVPVKVEAIDIKKAADDLASLSGSIGLVGNVNISGAELDVDQWLGGKKHTMDFLVNIGTIRNGVAQNKLGVSKVMGKIDYQLEARDFIVDMSGLSGFLSGDKFSAKIDLTSLFISLGLNTNIGIPMAADITIVPYYGAEAGTPDQKRIEIDASESADVQTQTTVKLDFASLLYQDEAKTKILDSLWFTFAAGSNPEKMCVYEPSASYNLFIEYAAGVPMAFGEDFEIVYKDKIDGLPEIIGTIIGYSGGLGLVGEVENSLPFNVGMKVRLCDSEGNVLGESSTDGPLIKSGDASGRPVTSKLDLMISMFDGASASAVSSIELELKLDTRTTAGVALKKDSYIKVNNLCARIPKGISVDLSEFEFDEPENGDVDVEEGQEENN